MAISAPAGYGGLVAGLGIVGALRHRRLPADLGLGDAVLLSIATHKLSRLVAKGGHLLRCAAHRGRNRPVARAEVFQGAPEAT